MPNAGIRCEQRPTSLVWTLRLSEGEDPGSVFPAEVREGVGQCRCRVNAPRGPSVVQGKRGSGCIVDDPLDGGEQQVRDRLPGVAFAGHREQVDALRYVPREDSVRWRVDAHAGSGRGAFDFGEFLETPCQGCIRSLLPVPIHAVRTGHSRPMRVDG